MVVFPFFPRPLRCLITTVHFRPPHSTRKEPRMTSCHVGRCVIVLLILIGSEYALNVQAEEPITPIGMLMVNPNASHRKLLKVQGIANEVQPYAKADVASSCGARFKITDETGTIEVSYRQLCQVGDERTTVI